MIALIEGPSWEVAPSWISLRMLRPPGGGSGSGFVVAGRKTQAQNVGERRCIGNPWHGFENLCFAGSSRPRDREPGRRGVMEGCLW